MKKNLKILGVSVLALAMLVGSVFLVQNSKQEKRTKKYSIISTSFPGYDLARAVTGNNTEVGVRMLLKPGAESHTFEPTPQDIVEIKNSNLFLYVGGDSDEWVKKIISEIDPKKTKVLKLVDLVKTKNEEVVEGMEEEHGHGHDKYDDHDKEKHEKHGHADHNEEPEVDEHVWTSPKNAKEIMNKVLAEVAKFDKAEETKLNENAKNYGDKLDLFDRKMRTMVETAKRKEIIVGDRFPLRYFVDEYNLKYYAAFPGCSEQTEANAKTISFIVKKVKEDKIPVVFKIELSKGLIAETVAKETGARVEEIHSGHNISEKDFEAGATYVDLMNRNFEVLKRALND